MALKKKQHHYFIITNGFEIASTRADIMHCPDFEDARTQCFAVMKEMTGDEKKALELYDSIDENFQTPPYFTKQDEKPLDVTEIESLLAQIVYEAG